MSPRAALSILLPSLMILLGGCGEETTTPDPTGTTNDPPVADLEIEPRSGVPGTLVRLSSEALSRAGDGVDLNVRIGGLDASVRTSPTGQTLATIPLMAAGADGATPPTAPVDVALHRDGALVARADGILTIDPLPPAAGSTDSLCTSLSRMTGELRRLVNAFDGQPSEPEGYALAVLAAVDSLVTGGDDASLVRTLDALATDDPATLQLLDRFVAASGLLETTRQLTDGLAGATWDEDVDPRRTGVADVELARKMQFHVLARLFGETVVHETAEEYAVTVGLATGAIGIGTSVPGAALVGAVVAVADFAVNKILLGVFPAELTSFEIVLEDDTLELGQITASRLDIAARNDPPEVGIQDFIGLTITLLGLGGSTADDFFEILENTAAYFLSTVQSGLAAYASEHPELGLDVSFAIVPEMTWEAVIHDPRLVDLLTFTPEIIEPLTDAIDWRASGPSAGEGRIHARTATGPDAVLIDVLPGFSYTGGAFGEEVRSTPTVSVFVSSDLVMEVDFAPEIAEGGINALEVRAGHLDADGQSDWQPGIDIELIVDGGSVAESTGQTDSDGQFITLAQIDPDATTILITVTATDAADQQVVETVQASVPVEAWIEVVNEPPSRRSQSLVQSSSYADVTGGPPDEEAHEETFAWEDAGSYTQSFSSDAASLWIPDKGPEEDGSCRSSATHDATLEMFTLAEHGVDSLAISGSLTAMAEAEYSGLAVFGAETDAIGQSLAEWVVRVPDGVTVGFRFEMTGSSQEDHPDVRAWSQAVAAISDFGGDLVEYYECEGGCVPVSWDGTLTPGADNRFYVQALAIANVENREGQASKSASVDFTISLWREPAAKLGWPTR